MQVTNSTLEKAMFRILRSHELEPWAAIDFRELQGLWAYTGLRQSDLREAVSYMFQQGLIDFQNDGSGLAIVLTPAGYERGHDQDIQLQTLLRDTRDVLNLRSASKRPLPSRTGPRQGARSRRQETQANHP